MYEKYWFYLYAVKVGHFWVKSLFFFEKNKIVISRVCQFRKCKSRNDENGPPKNVHFGLENTGEPPSNVWFGSRVPFQNVRYSLGNWESRRVGHRAALLFSSQAFLELR